MPQVHVGPFSITCILFGFQSFDFERTWWSLFPKRVDIWVFITLLFNIDVDLFHDNIHYTLREVLTHKKMSTPPCFIKVPVSSHESEQLCARVLNVPIMPLYTVFSVGYLELFFRAWFFYALLHYVLNIYMTGPSLKWMLLQFIFQYFFGKLLR